MTPMQPRFFFQSSARYRFGTTFPLLARCSRANDQYVSASNVCRRASASHQALPVLTAEYLTFAGGEDP